MDISSSIHTHIHDPVSVFPPLNSQNNKGSKFWKIITLQLEADIIIYALSHEMSVSNVFVGTQTGSQWEEYA